MERNEKWEHVVIYPGVRPVDELRRLKDKFSQLGWRAKKRDDWSRFPGIDLLREALLPQPDLRVDSQLLVANRARWTAHAAVLGVASNESDALESLVYVLFEYDGDFRPPEIVENYIDLPEYPGADSVLNLVNGTQSPHSATHVVTAKAPLEQVVRWYDEYPPRQGWVLVPIGSTETLNAFLENNGIQMERPLAKNEVAMMFLSRGDSLWWGVLNHNPDEYVTKGLFVRYSDYPDS